VVVGAERVVVVVVGTALLVVVVGAALDVVVVAAPVLVVVVGAERVVVVVVGTALLVVVVGAGHSDAIIEPQVPVVVTVPQVQVPALHALTTLFVQRLNTPPLNPDSPASSVQALRLHGDEGAAACPNEGAALSQKRAATTVIVRVEVPVMPPFSRGGRHPHGPLHTWKKEVARLLDERQYPEEGRRFSRPNLSANVPFHIEGPCQRRGRAPCSTRGFRRRRPGRPRGHRCARRRRGSRRHASRTRPCAARRERRGRAPGWPGGWRRRSGWHAPDRRPGAICATGRGRQLRIGCDQPRSPPEDRLTQRMAEWSRRESNPRPLECHVSPDVRRPAKAADNSGNIGPPGPPLSVALGGLPAGVHRQNTDSTARAIGLVRRLEGSRDRPRHPVWPRPEVIALVSEGHGAMRAGTPQILVGGILLM